MKMYTVYAINSLTRNYIYVGLTNNLERRFKQHNEKRERTTRSYAPFELLYSKELPDRILARSHEKYLKSEAGKEFLRSFW